MSTQKAIIGYICPSCHHNPELLMEHAANQACSMYQATENGLIGKKIEIRGVRANIMRLMTVVEDCDSPDTIKIWQGPNVQDCTCENQQLKGEQVVWKVK